MKRWTTDSEFEWLANMAPGWKEAQKTKNTPEWLIGTTKAFLEAFPERASSGVQSLNQVCHVYFRFHSILTLGIAETPGMVWQPHSRSRTAYPRCSTYSPHQGQETQAGSSPTIPSIFPTLLCTWDGAPRTTSCRPSLVSFWRRGHRSQVRQVLHRVAQRQTLEVHELSATHHARDD